MSIIAVISIIGVSALTRTKSQNELGDVSETIKSEVRLMKSNAQTIQGLCSSGSKPKIWAVSISNNTIQKYQYCNADAAKWQPVGSSISFNNVQATFGGPSGITLAYNTPKGNFYSYSGLITSTTSGTPNGDPDESHRLTGLGGGGGVARTINLVSGPDTSTITINSTGSISN